MFGECPVPIQNQPTVKPVGHFSICSSPWDPSWKGSSSYFQPKEGPVPRSGQGGCQSPSQAQTGLQFSHPVQGGLHLTSPVQWKTLYPSQAQGGATVIESSPERATAPMSWRASEPGISPKEFFGGLQGSGHSGLAECQGHRGSSVRAPCTVCSTMSPQMPTLAWLHSLLWPDETSMMCIKIK